MVLVAFQIFEYLLGSVWGQFWVKVWCWTWSSNSTKSLLQRVFYKESSTIFYARTTLCVKSKLLLATLFQSSTLGSSAFHYSFMAVSVLSFEGENNSLIICLMQSVQLHNKIFFDCNWKWQNSCHLFDQWFTEEYWIEQQDGHQKKVYQGNNLFNKKLCSGWLSAENTQSKSQYTTSIYLQIDFCFSGSPGQHFLPNATRLAFAWTNTWESPQVQTQETPELYFFYSGWATLHETPANVWKAF